MRIWAISNEVFEDAFNLLCGERIGVGVSREVFVCTLIPGWVVKVETDQSVHQNILEWEVWKDVMDTSASRWFAECKWISPNGMILIQERTRPPGDAELLPRVPIWFTDIKRANWGMAKTNGRKEYLVCHDYGVNNIMHYGVRSKRMKKAVWTDNH